ncbi:MAG: hypothetical protein V2A76_02165 [Planctomycetota bacterium]
MPIYDNSYRRIEGIRPPSRLLFLPIAGTGVKLFFRKRLPKVLGAMALVPFLGMVLILAAPHLLSIPGGFPDELLAVLNVTGAGLYVYLAKWEWIFLILFTAMSGSGLIANDLRANALEIYFSRPLTLLDYFLGKLLVILSILLGLTLIPCLLLWSIDVILCETPGYWLQQLHMLPRIICACLLMTVPYALLMLAISSLARTARNAMLLFVGVVIMTGTISNILRHALDEPLYGLISINLVMQRLMAIPLDPDVNMVATLSMGGRGVPMLDVPVIYPLMVLLGVLGFCCLIFFRRVRGVEVVSG